MLGKFFLAPLFAGLVVSTAAYAKLTDTYRNPGHDNCEYCHTPSSPTKLGETVWTRQMPTTVRYTMYDSPTMDMATAAQPQGVSLLCLSCHDGVILDGTVEANSGSKSSGRMPGGNLLIGMDGLANDHPVSITYNPALDRGLNAPAAGKVGSLPLYRAAGGGIAFDQIECTTCHDPHNKTFNYYLRMDNTASALCLTCHNK